MDEGREGRGMKDRREESSGGRSEVGMEGNSVDGNKGEKEVKN